MNAMKRILVLMVLSLMVLAPVHAQDVLAPDYVMRHLKKGVTTRADVLRLFGQPTSQDVRVSSESGSVETLIYSSAPPQTAKKKRSGSFGSFLRTARGIVGDVSAITGKSYGSGIGDGLRRAESAANAADRISAAAGETAPSEETASRPVTLMIRLENGVVTSYEMG